MKKLVVISLNLILVVGFLNLKSQNEFNNLENRMALKKELFKDFHCHGQLLPPSPIKQNNRAIADYGETPGLNWKGQFGGTGYDNVNAITSDENDNIYITGSFEGQMSLNGNTYTSTGKKEAFVAKFNESGNLIWLTQIPAAENNETYCKDICMDANGFLYVTGYYTGSIDIGGSHLPYINIYNMFYAKLNDEGDLISGTYHSQDVYEIGFAIDTDDNGNIYISSSRSYILDSRHSSWLLKYDQLNNLVGETQYEIGFNNIVVSGNNIYYSGVIQNGDDGYIDENVTLTSPSGYYDVFVAKSNLAGVFEWGITASHEEPYNGDSNKDILVLDNLGNCFLAGTFIRNLIFGDDTIKNSGSNEGFITKLNAQGSFLWLKQYVGSKVTLSSDLSGNAYTTGNSYLYKYNTDGAFLWEAELEKQPTTNCLNSDNKIIVAGNNIGLNYVTQLNNEAVEEWTIQFEGNSGAGELVGMVTDDIGNIYTYNYASNPMDYFGETVNTGNFICKQNGQGEVIWIRSFPNIQVKHSLGNYLAIDPDNENIYITGEFYNELVIPDGPTLVPSENGSVFVIKYDVNGDYRWSLQEDFVGEGLSLVADYSNNIILSGTFIWTISISGTELVSAGSEDCFMAKYDVNANLIWAKRAGGESIEFIGLVSVDGNNNVYLTGEFVSENVTVDNTEHLMLAGEGNIIFAKLSPSGEVLWIKSFAASLHEWYDDVSWPTGIKTDIEGNTYIKGNFSYIAYFDDILLENPSSYFNKFITKIDSDGNALWAKQITQPKKNHQFDYNQFDIDNEGSVYFGVQAEDTLFFGDDFQYYPTSPHDLFVAKYSTLGNLDWVKTMNGNEYSYSWISSVAVFNTTNVFVGGFFNNYLSIDGQELTSTNRHGFVSMFGEDISGFNDIYNSVGITIYPNPAVDKISISSNLSLQYAELKIYSVSGKLIKTEIIGNQNQIDVSKLKNGAYFVKIYTDESVFVSKFIKL